MQHSHTYRIRTSQCTDQKCGKSVPSPTQEEMRSIGEHLIQLNKLGEQFQNFFSPASRKKLKHPIAQPDTARQEITQTMTAKAQSYSNFQAWWTRTPAANSGFVSYGVKCLNSSVVFQFNFSAGLTVLCPEIPHERMAANRSLR